MLIQVQTFSQFYQNLDLCLIYVKGQEQYLYKCNSNKNKKIRCTKKNYILLNKTK